jgi:hypothetical protein
MRLIPWTLRSGSEQFIYNWKLEEQPGPGSRKLEAAQRNVREYERKTGTKVMLRRYANKSRVKVFTHTIIGMYLCPGSRAEKAEKITGGKKEKVVLRYSHKLS